MHIMHTMAHVITFKHCHDIPSKYGALDIVATFSHPFLATISVYPIGHYIRTKYINEQL